MDVREIGCEDVNWIGSGSGLIAGADINIIDPSSSVTGLVRNQGWTLLYE